MRTETQTKNWIYYIFTRPEFMELIGIDEKVVRVATIETTGLKEVRVVCVLAGE